MREALNENTTVQIVVIGALLLLTGLLLATGMLRGSEDEAEAPSPVAVETTQGAPDSGSALPGTSGGASSGSVGTAIPPPASSTQAGLSAAGVALPSELLPEPPARLVRAFRRGDAIALLVIRAGGIEDALVRASMRRLRGEPRVAVFATRAEFISRFAAITQGVGVNRVPALVVLKPGRPGGGPRRATVSYGFRSAQSVVQAVRDALYSAGRLPYHPG